MISFGDVRDFIAGYFQPVQLGEVKGDEFLRYFPGGWQGVKKRFGDAFRREIRRTKTITLAQICGVCEIGPEIIQEIGNGDYRRMDSNIVNLLTNTFQCTVDTLLREPQYSVKERADLLQKIHDIGFGPVCGTRIVDGRYEHVEGDVWSPDEIVRMYLMLEALREL